VDGRRYRSVGTNREVGTLAQIDAWRDRAPRPLPLRKTMEIRCGWAAKAIEGRSEVRTSDDAQLTCSRSRGAVAHRGTSQAMTSEGRNENGRARSGLSMAKVMREQRREEEVEDEDSTVSYVVLIYICTSCT
jgi:hypothetical protein